MKRNLLSGACILIGVFMIASYFYLKANAAVVLATATDEVEREALQWIIGGIRAFALVGVMGVALGIVMWVTKGRVDDSATNERN